jgi:competence protein ComEA
MGLFGTGLSGARYLQPTQSLSFKTVDKKEEQPAPSVPNTAPKTAVVVHVAGAVKVPGILHMSSEDRVGDAIKRAGGARLNADLDQLNLAAKLVDGTQIYVPAREKILAGSGSRRVAEAPRRPKPQISGSPYASSLSVEPLYGSVGPARAPKVEAANHADTPPAGTLVSLNTATSEELESLPGIGPATAAKILDFRRQQGKFTSIEQLLEVKGIGPKKMEAIRGLIRL